MRCLDRLGANVVMQDEANPGQWTGEDGDGIQKWQPLSWMTSTWRAAADRSVSFDYNVTPHLVGNLADLTFDGQTRDHPARAARAELPLHRQPPLDPGRGPPRPARRGGRQDRVHRDSAVGAARRPAQRPARGRGTARARVRRPAGERLPRDRGDRRPDVPARPRPRRLRAAGGSRGRRGYAWRRAASARASAHASSFRTGRRLRGGRVWLRGARLGSTAAAGRLRASSCAAGVTWRR